MVLAFPCHAHVPPEVAHRMYESCLKTHGCEGSRMVNACYRHLYNIYEQSHPRG